MDCITTKLNEEDQFITRLVNSDETINEFYQFDAMANDNYKYKVNQSTNDREQELANVIHQYMSDLTLTSQQLENIEHLREGAKVVIGGQQAGLFGGPLYTFHKIFSIITLSQSLTNDYQTPIVPVFWIAGEDHDFDEVNHTFVYSNHEAQLHKVKYHTLEPPEDSVSNFYPNKLQLKDALNQFFKHQPETKHTKELLTLSHSIIDRYDSWTAMFKALLHEVFKDYGVLFIDAQDNNLRTLEQPFLKELINRFNDVDASFRSAQAKLKAQGYEQMIQTDTNVHLFIEENNMRQLLTYEDGKFKTNKTNTFYTKEELLSIVEEAPQRFSNNVVTRPLMEEWLFNTVAFVGGPSEIKYWAELNEVFQTLKIEMPIVIPRLRISYINDRIEKLSSKYAISIEEIISQGTNATKNKFIRARASDTFINNIEKLKQQQIQLYETLKAEVQDNNDNRLLLDKNNKIHMQQYDYLINRYLLNIERENEISMKHFRELNHALHPMKGLQERIWNPLQIMNEFGTDVFSPSTYPPLSYTFDHIVIKC
ncbi:bacillithiol biosynthesis cysteine-adding enzyme BshC [Staphylococcus durrellii]|uniref:bacillithiol biosynthesis cysteine-adding enzyme BshC n=1 Tax=Staphylococcus durrellii TaxID=2781773 RepID=UPI00189C89E1|nr:bacillithiol biosynthesis cysteine-adding enzyme BshC [Staphylococcus durrellii]MBF7017360.1 bacillithiol biosynthesis cysteine-adding enzyme BshC [Staphylococcus durrellii]